MILKQMELFLPEGRFLADVIQFETTDSKKLNEIYRLWRKLSEKLISIHGRQDNLPDGLSEGAFCLSTNSVKVIKIYGEANSSFDCYQIKTKKRIQIKACSMIPDLTSFGPRSEWDELYFCVFYRNGDWDGKFDVYKISNDIVYSHKVNKTQSFKDQQSLNRRPSFSIYSELILKKKLRPKTYQI